MSNFEETLEVVFLEAAGIQSQYDLFMLYPYVRAESDEETLEQISDLSANYDDPGAAEIGYIAVWKYLIENKSQW